MARARLLAAVLLAAATAFASTRTEQDPSKGLNLYSIPRELSLGQQLSKELERQVKLVDDPTLSEYVNRLAQNLSRQIAIPFPVSVRVIESGDLNAFALPGGHVYVTSAILQLTESEAELAFVLSHELGHVAARHSTREATQAKLLNASVGVLGGLAGFALRGLGSAGCLLQTSKTSRHFESEADGLGIRILTDAGYDPASASDLFERMEARQRKEHNWTGRLMDDHPQTATRAAQVEKQIAAIHSNREAWIVNTSEYEAIRLRIAAIETARIATAILPPDPQR